MIAPDAPAKITNNVPIVQAIIASLAVFVLLGSPAEVR